MRKREKKNDHWKTLQGTNERWDKTDVKEMKGAVGEKRTTAAFICISVSVYVCKGFFSSVYQEQSN